MLNILMKPLVYSIYANHTSLTPSPTGGEGGGVERQSKKHTELLVGNTTYLCIVFIIEVMYLEQYERSTC